MEYDPQGDERENPGLVVNLTDGSDVSAWMTESYGSADMGEAKDGVGLSFTLDKEARLLEILSLNQGWQGELLVENEVGELTAVAKLTGANRQIVETEETFKVGRIWITSLAEGVDDRYDVQIAELRFYR